MINVFSGLVSGETSLHGYRWPPSHDCVLTRPPLCVHVAKERSPVSLPFVIRTSPIELGPHPGDLV